MKVKKLYDGIIKKEDLLEKICNYIIHHQKKLGILVMM